MKTQSAKAKGRRLQQLVVSKLLERFPELSEDDIRSTSMGAQGEDVQLSARARENIPFSFECKNQERLNVWEAIEQSKSNCKGYTPLVVMKKNKSEPHVILSLDDFLKVISKGKHNIEQDTSEIIKILQNTIDILKHNSNEMQVENPSKESNL